MIFENLDYFMYMYIISLIANILLAVYKAGYFRVIPSAIFVYRVYVCSIILCMIYAHVRDSIQM